VLVIPQTLLVKGAIGSHRAKDFVGKLVNP
jgi:hypothetical protein